MKIKTSDLVGVSLDWAVAKSLNTLPKAYLIGENFKNLHADSETRVHYSTNWALGGPIIEREKIAFTCEDFLNVPNRRWLANIHGSKLIDMEFGPTHLIAAMRCYVASKLGEEVDVPVDLV